MKIGCTNTGCDIPSPATALELNQSCYCKTLDRDAITHILNTDDVSHDLLATYPQLFSNIASFITHEDANYICDSIAAIERVIALPAYRQHVLSQAHRHAQFDPGTAGVFMGYDFHLGQGRPKLIEINTNAGGAFLNALLLSAQIACCPPLAATLSREKLYDDFFTMFSSEWKLQRGDIPLTRIAIVDDLPDKQFLYPEFKMAQHVFENHGIEAVITVPEHLEFERGKLLHQGKPIDLVYNRLTDFTLTNKPSESLNRAYQAGVVVVTPNPHHHALYADKGNLTLLSDEVILKSFGAAEEDIRTILSTVPVTRRVTADNAEHLWQERKHLFFKPAAGFGGKATYRGDKMTHNVWQNILQSDEYVAQQKVVPGERGILLDGQPSALKMDVRAYVYQRKIQLLAARLYQGQTTNFRTSGGGFSPIFIA